jgi:putative tryptophan/tyrosine transport system substrate-binding protein
VGVRRQGHRVTVRLGRRSVLRAGIGAALMPGTLVAQTQPRDAIRRLGVLTAVGAGDPLWQTRVAILVQALAERHWYEGANLRIDWRLTGGDPALYERYAAELVALDPDVLWAAGTPSVAALRRQTPTIPIVFVIVTDPVGQGFVESLAHPGGNITGFTDFDPPMAGKWLGMLAQITPAPTHVAVLYNPAAAPFAPLMLSAIENAAPSFAVAVRVAPVRDDAEIEATIRDLAGGERGSLLVLPDSFTFVHRDAIVALAARYRLPAVYWNRPFVDEGGLMAYGVDGNDLYRRAADYVDRILKGDKPGDLPVQNPTKFELVINLRTAQALGITVAPTLLAAADEVVE